MIDPDEVADVASSDALAARTATAEAEVDADGRMAQLLVATLVADEDAADEAAIDADACAIRSAAAVTDTLQGASTVTLVVAVVDTEADAAIAACAARVADAEHDKVEEALTLADAGTTTSADADAVAAVAIAASAKRTTLDDADTDAEQDKLAAPSMIDRKSSERGVAAKGAKPSIYLSLLCVRINPIRVLRPCGAVEEVLPASPICWWCDAFMQRYVARVAVSNYEFLWVANHSAVSLYSHRLCIIKDIQRDAVVVTDDGLH